jgi:hypothetical protein
MAVPEEAPGSLPEFIEKFAAVLIMAGFAPMAARVFVALLVSDSGGLTAATCCRSARPPCPARCAT